MAAASQEEAVRLYLVSLKDPSALRDDQSLEDLRRALESTNDGVERLRLQQQIIEAEQPSVERYEADFVTHAKDWAEQHGISEKAFASEGVPAGVLRRAGFRGVRGGGRGTRRTAGARRSRVSAEDVRAAIPRKGTFTVKQLQDLSGASPQVVRRIVQEEGAAGKLVDEGTDPDHSGPGRAPTLYRRKGRS